MGMDDQAATPGRTTLLDAVNILLEAVGEMPVSTIDTTGPAESHIAKRTVLEAHKEGQTRGWTWNTDEGFPFQVNSRHELHLPANVVRWVPDRYAWGRRFQQRGQRVWDTQCLSYVLPEEIPHLVADVVWLLPFEECPEQFNRWATVRAARMFSARVLGNDSLVKFTLKDEQDAYRELQLMEAEQGQFNMLTDGPFGTRAFPTYQPNIGLAERLHVGTLGQIRSPFHG